MKIVALLVVLFSLVSCATADCGCGHKTEPHLTLNLGSEWKCIVEDGAVTVCRATAGPMDRVIMWTMKPKNSRDSLEEFEKKLSETKVLKYEGRPDVLSQPMSQKRVYINGQEWLDAVQFQSEVPGFFTRYLATIDGDLSVLVTFSAAKSAFQQFNRDIQPVIDTLVVRR